MVKNRNSVNWCQTSAFGKLSGCQKWGFRKPCIFCLLCVAQRETGLFLSVSYENHCSPCNSSVSLDYCWFNLCFTFLFWVLAFCFCFLCHLFQDVSFFSASCLVLFWTTRLDLLIHCILFSCYVFGLSFFGNLYFLILATHQKHLSKNWIFGNPPKWKMHKKDIFTRAVSTGVLTNGVFFSFWVCLYKFTCFAENIVDSCFSPPPQMQINLC